MGLAMVRDGDAFHPVVSCDGCGREVDADGLVLWRIDGDRERMEALVACGEVCAGALMEAEADDGDWAATALDAYLASLGEALAIDADGALERERATLAALHTRDQAPD